MSAKRSMTLAAVALAVSLTATACGGSGNGDGSGGGTGKLEVFSWWTSGSESKALDVLFTKFKSDSNDQVVNAAVSGGGGSNAQQALQTRLQGGNPPDSWQLHPDQDLASAVEDGSVADITKLYDDNGWAAKLPETIAKMVQHDGKYYAVPVNAHRANVLWTNPKLLRQAGVSWDKSTTVETMIADLRKIKSTGKTPLCLGDKDVFASAQLLESLILSEVGPDGWAKLFAGQSPFDDAKVRTAVTDYVTLLGLVNSDHSALTWDQAALNVPKGKCAANLMGDWAYGEMVNKGFKEGTDFGYLAFPGTSDTFLFVGDAFVKPADNAPDPQAEDIWLKALLDPTVQKDFNLAKGSSPVRTDVSLDGFPPYQKAAAQDLRSLKIVSSVAHHQGAPAEFAQTYLDAVTALNGDKNVDAFVKKMTTAQQNLSG
jgi:glucose/mannose transport system substrate-binding protein